MNNLPRLQSASAILKANVSPQVKHALYLQVTKTQQLTPKNPPSP